MDGSGKSQFKKDNQPDVRELHFTEKENCEFQPFGTGTNNNK
jgi:hypothetical protein